MDATLAAAQGRPGQNGQPTFRLGLVAYERKGYNGWFNSRKIATVNSKPRKFDPAGRSPDDKPRVRRIGSLVNQLMSRRGYAQVVANDAIHQTIASVLDPHLSKAFQGGNLRAGVLQIYSTDSVSLQELNFRKRVMLKQLQQTLPNSKVTDLRFRIQT